MFTSRIHRVGVPDVDDEVLEPGGQAVPDHLKPYYDAAPGLPRRQRRRLEAEGSVTVHPLRQRIGVREDIRQPETLSVDEYEHVLKLGQAEELRRQAELDAVLHAGDTRCDLCGQVQPAGALAGVSTSGRELRLCVGACYGVVAGELERRRFAGRLVELLGSVDAPAGV